MKRISLNSNGAVTVEYKESVDRELFDDIQRVGGSDPFGASSAREAGWAVAAETENGSHNFAYSKTVPLSQLAEAELPGGRPVDFGPGRALDFSLKILKTRGANELVDSTTQTIPALLHPENVNADGKGDQNPMTAVANAIKNAEYIDAIASVHLEVKTPGKVTSANGTILADGTSRWDLRFAKPIVLRMV